MEYSNLYHPQTPRLNQSYQVLNTYPEIAARSARQNSSQSLSRLQLNDKLPI